MADEEALLFVEPPERVPEALESPRLVRVKPQRLPLSPQDAAADDLAVLLDAGEETSAAPVICLEI